jgi:hypothetical protein
MEYTDAEGKYRTYETHREIKISRKLALKKRKRKRSKREGVKVGNVRRTYCNTIIVFLCGRMSPACNYS